jgi:hypothetical protein
MTAAEIKSFFSEQIRAVKADYVKDLEALSEEQLGQSPGGGARSAFDFTYEVGFVNNRIAQRLRGETPEFFEDKGWILAPEEYRSKETAIGFLSESMDQVVEAWEAVPESDIRKPITTQTGGQTNPLDLAFMCAYHTGYHDAQLNYLQAIHGDTAVHWGS